MRGEVGAPLAKTGGEVRRQLVEHLRRANKLVRDAKRRCPFNLRFRYIDPARIVIVGEEASAVLSSRTASVAPAPTSRNAMLAFGRVHPVSPGRSPSFNAADPSSAAGGSKDSKHVHCHCPGDCQILAASARLRDERLGEQH